MYVYAFYFWRLIATAKSRLLANYNIIITNQLFKIKIGLNEMKYK